MGRGHKHANASRHLFQVRVSRMRVSRIEDEQAVQLAKVIRLTSLEGDGKDLFYRREQPAPGVHCIRGDDANP